MSTDNIAEFWSRLAGINAGFLGTEDEQARPVPMSHQLRDGDATVWFITARDTDLAREVARGSTRATYLIAGERKGLYAVLAGDLHQNDDPALRDELWSVVADSWFDRGKDDPDICVLGLTIAQAEVWLTPASGLKFAFSVIKAQATGAPPDMGTHFEATGAELAAGRQAG